MTKKLLILACGAYSEPLTELRSAVSDAKRLGFLLGKRNVGGFKVARIIDPSLVEAQVAIHNHLSEASAADFVIVYLSGHGVKDSYGRFYLALPETNLETLAATSLSGRFIREQMADAISRKLILILDTCFAGTFSRDMITKSAPVAAGLLDEFADERGHVVMAATSAIQYAFETIDEKPTSLFTKTICDGIESGEADLDSDGTITLEELFNYVSERMRGESRAQTPEISYLDVNARIEIARSPKLSASSAVEPDVSLALSSPHPELRLAAVKILGVYAKNVNQNKRALARARLRGLRNDNNDEIREAVGSLLGRTYRHRLTTAEFKEQSTPLSGDTWASLDGRSLQLAGEQSPRFASYGSDLPVLATVAMQLSESTLKIYATDRYRLDWRCLKTLADGDLPFFVLLSANDFSALKSLPAEAEVRVIVHKRDICFAVGLSVLRVRRELHHDLPKIENIIRIAGRACSASRLKVIEAVESLICDHRMRLEESITLGSSLSPRPTLQIVASDNRRLRGKVPQISIPAEGEALEATIQLNYQRFLEALDSFEEERVFFQPPRVSGPLLILNAEKDASHRHAIMPLEMPEG